MMKIFTILLILTAPAISYSVKADQPYTVPSFSEGSLAGWETESFVGNTRYQIVDQEGIKVLQAASDGSASGLYFKQAISLTPETTLKWRWKVSQIDTQLDENSKQGDDYPARIYIVVSDGPFFWQSRTLVYVWSNNQPEGSRWLNAYTDKAAMWALNSGKKELNQWQYHARKLQKDLFTAFGKRYDKIEAIALMTDSDNSGGQFLSWYGDITVQ